MIWWWWFFALRDAFAARKWNKYLLGEMSRRPHDKVKVLAVEGQVLGWGLREPQGIAIPFDWVVNAAAVEDATGVNRVQHFYFGPKYEAVAVGRKGKRWKLRRLLLEHRES